MKNRRFEIVHNLTLAAASIVAGLAAFHSLAAQQTSSARILNARSLKCLQPVSGSNAEGAAIVLATCDTTNDAQYWVKVPVSGNVAHYMNQSSQMCLDARGAAANGTPVQQWQCDKITNENWQYAQDSSDTAPKLISRVSSTNTYCLAIPGEGTDDGTAVQILKCNGSSRAALVRSVGDHGENKLRAEPFNPSPGGLRGRRSTSWPSPNRIGCSTPAGSEAMAHPMEAE